MENVNKVDNNQWKKWNEAGKRMFNNLFDFMKNNQDLFIHPKTEKVSQEQWETTAWNAAWIAADYATEKNPGNLVVVNEE